MRIEEPNEPLVVANAVDVPVQPKLRGKRSGLSLRVRLNLIGRTVHDIDVSSIRVPTRRARGGAEMLIGISNTAIMLGFEFVSGRPGRGIAAFPELFDEVVSLFVGGGLVSVRQYI